MLTGLLSLPKLLECQRVSVEGEAYSSGQLIEDQLEEGQIPFRYSQLHKNSNSNAQIIGLIDAIAAWLHHYSPSQQPEMGAENAPPRKLSLSASTLFGQSDDGMCRYPNDGRIGHFFHLIVDRLVEVFL